MILKFQAIHTDSDFKEKKVRCWVAQKKCWTTEHSVGWKWGWHYGFKQQELKTISPEGCQTVI